MKNKIILLITLILMFCLTSVTFASGFLGLTNPFKRSFSANFLDTNGKPISDAVVSLGSLTAITDKSGKFSFSDLNAGQYVLVIDKIGFDKYINNVDLKSDVIWTIKTPPNGQRYEGDLVNGVPNGKGIVIYPNGGRYEGNFIKGKKTGTGIMTWSNGERYEGEFVDGLLHGNGVYTWPNGKRYEGEFKDGKYYGKGIFTYVGGNRYEGEFKDGTYYGKGIFTYVSGARYEGDFVGGYRNGKGIFTDVDGSRYEGDFVGGYYNGYGTLYLADGSIKQQGKFAGGKFIE